jgi:hypothetical protein
MLYKYILVLAVIAGLVWAGGCKTSKTNTTVAAPVDDTITSDNLRKLSRNKDIYNAIKEIVPLDTAWLAKDTLHILTTKVLGCDADNFQLFWNGAVMKSLPPQVTVRLYQQVDAACTEKHRFHLLYNVKSLKLSHDTTTATADTMVKPATILHIGGYKNAVKYAY